ncbi:6-carboxytetrahydropterin synthase [Streptomyces sp. NPDC006649]|uniref:6-pyruvoyl trahydropterin synthase family protein n=1 Tax=unclassified Streptomyces TaxID=2593676 RepID=UPI00324DF8A5
MTGFKISKQFHFSASHRLSELPEGHPCSRMHGHNYVVDLELAAPVGGLTKAGFVRDYGDLSAFSSWLDGEIDHRHLNDVLTDRNPSAEHLAQWIFERWVGEFPELVSVRVSETPKTSAEYRP